MNKERLIKNAINDYYQLCEKRKEILKNNNGIINLEYALLRTIQVIYEV